MTTRKTFMLPVGFRRPLQADELATLVARLAHEITTECGPADAALVAVGIVKVIGELVRGSCGEEVTAQMLTQAIEASATLHVDQQPPPEDPDEDPFTLPD